MVNHGVIAIHIYTLEIVFVIDVKLYLYEMYYLSYLKEEDQVEVTAILMLSDTLIGFIINKLGLLIY